MSNNYMTEEYMTSILQQYQQNSPQKTSSENVSQNLDQFLENGEHNRRQLNESLFKSIDDSFERQMNQMSIDTTRMTDTPIRVQQMVRNPVITSDSFRRPQPVRNEGPTRGQQFQSHYSNRAMVPNRVRPQYRAKVIDYYNGIIEKPNPLSQNFRGLSMPSSVLTERNIGPISRPNRIDESVNALHSAISSIGQKTVPQKPFIPKPILKNSTQNTNQLKPAFNPFASVNNNNNNNNNLVNNNNQRSVLNADKSCSAQTKVTPERDTLVNGYEKDCIIRTIDSDNNETFYCYYCNTYMKKGAKVEKHCRMDFHKINICKTIENSLNNSLNKRFIFGQIARNEALNSCGLTDETVFRMELDRIPPQNKHFYYSNGIRMKNPSGSHAYYCRFCEQSIQCLSEIENHLLSKIHSEKQQKTSFSKFLSQTTEPIIGLQFINEYMSVDLLQPIYECTLCMCFEDAYDMYLHVLSFKHNLNLLKNLNPNETTLNSIKESIPAIKEIKRRIIELSKTMGKGSIQRRNCSPNLKKIRTEQKRKVSDIEVIDITDEDEDNSALKKSCAIRVSNNREAADAEAVIHYLKESIVKFYLNKIPSEMRRVLITQAMDDDEDLMDLDIR